MKIELKKENLKPIHSSLEIVDGMARVSKIENLDEADSNTFVMINDVITQDCVIDVDVCGKLGDDAPASARGFIGLVFRSNDSSSEFESFYIRPANGRDCNDPIRKSHGCQYFAFPGYTFSYFRAFGITDYEGQVPTIALNEWAHIRAEIAGDTANFFVDGNHVLTVSPLKHSPGAGKIGLFTDIGTDGYFKNLSIEELE